jgi:hypothetical protein
MTILSEEIRDLIRETTSRFDLWVKILNKIQAENIAEIGVWKGEFAEHLLLNLGSINQYFLIDPWSKLPDWNKPFNVDAEVFDAIYDEAIHRTAFASSKLRVLRGRTKEVINSIQDESLDFAYIDGDHTLRGITIDLHKILPKIRNNGFIGGDDFISTPWQHSFKFEPTLVCPYSVYFSEAQDLPIYALPFNQFLIQKISESKFTFMDFTGNYSDLSINKLPSEFEM